MPAGHTDFGGPGKDRPDGPVPAGVDYEFWAGPAQLMPFNPCRFHKNWRWNTATRYHVECKYTNNVEMVMAGGHGGIQDGAKGNGPNGWGQVAS